MYEAVTEKVGRRLGIATELVVETPYESCERDEYEVCFVCSLPYVTLERRGIRDALVAMAEDPDGRERLAAGLVERFVPVGPEDYDDIRMMVEACEAAGFAVLR